MPMRSPTTLALLVMAASAAHLQCFRMVKGREVLKQGNRTKGMQRPLRPGNCSDDFEVFPYKEPGSWGTRPGWQACGEGQQQSPIDIPARTRRAFTAGPLDLTFSAVPKPVFLNNGHSAKVKGEFLKFNLAGNTYSAKQFHFHTPSEHTVAGKGFAMEMHIVSTNEGGAAVIGILFKLGKANKCLTNFREVPRPGCEEQLSMAVDLACFEEQLEGPWWSYDGSLTTPPCTEGVKWQVMRKRATLSLAQLLIFKSRFRRNGGNARPPQPLNGREVLLAGPDIG